ncbi:hypothetical protein GLAREA_01881 [Glarea lozoyensis ATCC 20868]|uniref:Uncharacterized protein n=1 Tax=Glarea lozoyensis (strain ATCC 20868 / MF5171) TaxID=1116229 RepID=S3CL69_GLAL2|nr:uncharacterized protein GLAREA_01881 [Glarea lozoyensis ATCC 20868]EPE25969.1 hypothetical protein GLAREA_01881 [Glarea lozoyensis ATCC 20868]
MVVRPPICRVGPLIRGQTPRLRPRFLPHHVPRSYSNRYGSKHDFPYHAATITLKSNSENTQNLIPKHLKKSFRPTAERLGNVEDQRLAIVILATPKFAPWLEDDAFIIKILQSITRPPKNVKTACDDIDVVCACVDGLTTSIEHIQDAKALSKTPEGLSFIHGVQDELLPGLWDEETPSTGHPDIMSTLVFSGRGDFNTKITLPLANTLFINGVRSTLQVSRWTWPSPSEVENFTGMPKKVKTLRKATQLINAFDNMDTKYPMTCIPAVPMTPVRTIASGMGNIVRQLNFEPFTPGPASRELEAAVDQHLKTLSPNNQQDTRPGIWALIVPDEVHSRTNANMNISMLSVYEEATKGKGIYGSPNTALLDYVGYWVRRGAKFCKVLSGGGGWGAKQGLLSLDPQSTYTQTEDISSEFMGTSVEEQQMSALGNIAKPGSFIRFFGRSSWSSVPDKTEPKRIKDFDPTARNVVVGTCASTIDDIPGDAQDDDTDYIRLRAGHFGCVTQSGLFVEKQPSDGGSAYETKLDMPNSFLFASMKSAYMNQPPSAQLEDGKINKDEEERDKFEHLLGSAKPTTRRVTGRSQAETEDEKALKQALKKADKGSRRYK